MTDEHGTAIPIDALSDPVAAYRVADDEPHVTATNAAFERRFDDLGPDTPAAAIFDRFDVVRSTSGSDPETHLADGDDAGIYLDDFGDAGPYLARVVATGDDAGHLVFTDLKDCLDVAETAGVGQVASVISHDLRNPLDVAGANLRAARETGESEHFDAVADAHDRMRGIIRDVLTLARGDEALNRSDGVAIRTAAEEAWQSVDTDRATLTVTGSLPTTTADPGRVRRLFENLFRNSVEHAVQWGDPADGDGESTASDPREDVTVTVGALDDGFYVADDGPGIPEDERDAVFDPGYTIDDGGTGLGLAIVETIVDAHGWDLTLTAAEDGGARFEVRLR